MKTTLLLFVLMTFRMASAQNYSSAIEYNDNIVELQNEIGNKMIVFYDQLNSENTTIESIQPFLDDLLNTTRDVIKQLEKMKPWDNGKELKEVTLELFRFYETTIDQDYRQMILIVYNDYLTDEDYTKLSELLEKVSEDEKVLDDRFGVAQQAFANHYGFDLEDNNEIQDKLDSE